MIGFFKTNRPVVLVVLLLIAMVLWAIAISQSFVLHGGTSLFRILRDVLPENSAFTTGLACLLVLYIAVRFNRIITDHSFDAKYTYLTAILVILFSSITLHSQMFHPLLLTNMLLMFIMDNTFRFKRKGNINGRIFNTGLLVGLTSLLFFPLITYLVVIWSALYIYRSFAWKEWMIAVVGVAIPWVFIQTFYFLFDVPIFRHTDFWPTINIGLPILEPATIFSIIIVFIASILVLFNTVKHYNKRKLNRQKDIKVTFWTMAINLVLFLLFFHTAPYSFALMVLPLSLFFANFLANTSRLLAFVTLSLLFIAVLCWQVFFMIS